MARDVKHGRCSVQIAATGIDKETGWMLVDISDTTNWPHTLDEGHVEIEFIHVEIDPTNDYQGHVHLGFLENVNGPVSDMNVLFCWQFETGGGRTLDSLYLYEHPIVCDSRFHYGHFVSDSAIFGSDKGLSGPPGGIKTFYSGEGDLVAHITCTAGEVTCAFTIGYNIVQDTN